MKIAFINDVVYAYAAGTASAVGGAERYQWLLARALAMRDWSVVVGVREALNAGERCMIDGVQFVGLGRGHALVAWYQFLVSARPDWWYWQGADHLWGPAVEIAQLAGVRTIFSAAVDRDVQPQHALFRRPRWWPLYAWGLARSDKIFVQHGGQLAGLAPRWRSKASVLPGIVGNMAAIKPHAERDKYVAWVAVLRQVKRPDVLIEIAQRLPTIRFVVCGGPSSFFASPAYTEWVLKALREQPNIECLGSVPPQQALHVIADAAILLSTSDEEGFPSTFLEAWSGGTPVISLKLDPDDLIERQELGTVPGNVERATADIVALMEAPQRRDAIAARARRYVADFHSEAAVTTVFQSALAGIRA